MKTLHPILMSMVLCLGHPAQAGAPRLDFGRVVAFRAGGSGANPYRIQSFAGCSIVFTYRMDTPVMEDPETLPILATDLVTCTLVPASAGRRASTLRVPWKELRAYLLRPRVGLSKGDSFFVGTLVINPAQHHRRELRMGGAGDLGAEAEAYPLTDSGANLPLGPILILGRLDDSLSSISNRLEPHLVVTKGTALRP